MKNNLLVTVLCLLGVYWLASCAKMDDTYRDFIKAGEIKYPRMPDSIWISPGYKRAKVSMTLSSAEIAGFKVFWNNGEAHVNVPIEQIGKKDTVSTIIELPEGSHTFDVYTFDKEGNQSIKKDAIGMVYGDIYMRNLGNRLVSDAALIKEEPRIAWLGVSSTEVIGTELSYQDLAGMNHRLFVPPGEEVTRINLRPLGDSIRYRTLYVPIPIAIDTFYSAYQTITLKPAVPAELDKTEFALLSLPGDAVSGWNMAGLWNGSSLIGSPSGGFTNSGGFPKRFTIDLGGYYELSQLRMWGVHDGREYNAGNVKQFELWGSAGEHDAGGGFDGWTLLGAYEVVKPSGLPRGELSDEDKQTASNGVNFTIDSEETAIRYIRMNILSTFGIPDGASSGGTWLTELALWGYPQ